MYYVTYYEEYPIYEPAEGGYYYAGSQNVLVREFKSWRKARQFSTKQRSSSLRISAMIIRIVGMDFLILTLKYVPDILAMIMELC